MARKPQPEGPVPNVYTAGTRIHLGKWDSFRGVFVPRCSGARNLHYGAPTTEPVTCKRCAAKVAA